MTDHAAADNVVRLKIPTTQGLPLLNRCLHTQGIDNDAILHGLFALLESIPGLTVIADMQGRMLYMNASGQEMLGIDRDASNRDRILSQHYTERASEYVIKQAIPTAIANGIWRGETTMLGRDRQEIPVSQVITFHPSAKSGGYLLSIAWDLCDTKKAEERLRHQATHDHLTGLPNRALVVDRLTQALNESQRHGNQSAVLFMDIDHFKSINDEYGHELANQLICEVANRLQTCVRRVDTVGRYGGDEFVFVLPGLDRHKDVSKVVAQVVARIRAAFAEPLTVGSHSLFVSASIGGAMYPGDGKDAQSLLHQADMMMYRRKKRNRNGYTTLGDCGLLSRYGNEGME